MVFKICLRTEILIYFVYIILYKLIVFILVLVDLYIFILNNNLVVQHSFAKKKNYFIIY